MTQQPKEMTALYSLAVNKKSYGEPFTFFRENGVISEQHLTQAERELNGGYTIIFTGNAKGVSQSEASPNETYTNPSENRTDDVIPAEEWERRYYQLRAAIRYASLRLNGYKLSDTANIAEELKTSKDLEQGTKSFVALFEEIEKQAFRKGYESSTNQYDPLLEKAQETERRLREVIRSAVSVLSPEQYHTGGFIKRGPRVEIHMDRGLPEIITLTSETLEAVRKMGRPTSEPYKRE